MLRFISVCAGIGGIDLGFEAADMQCVAQVEINDYARSILKRHWPDVPRFRDLRSVSAWTLPACDVLVGGIPCQPHSLAGRRGGSADNRDLWPEFYRLIRELRPRYAVIENVPGLRSSEHGRFFARILRDLAEAGYDAEWVDLSATSVGAPHQRERVWIVAYPNGRRTYKQSERFAWSCNPPHLDRDGTLRPLADADGQRCAEQHASAVASPTRQSDWRVDALNVAHAQCSCDRSQVIGGQTDRPDTTRPAGGISGSGWRQTQPAMGRIAHGLFAGLDIASAWPEDWEKGTPRTTDDRRTRYRIARLKGLGNAVVPQCAEVIGRYIVQHYEANL